MVVNAGCELDHLVVAARSLDQGARWCEATLGVVPGAGGKHALMGTHNRLLRIASERFPRAYLEIIAVDPDAGAPPRRRWFGLDEPALQRALDDGPRLLHWVARVADLDAALQRLRDSGHESGRVIAAERATQQGLLRWRIAVRDDGRLLARGALPTLIEWGAVHPCDSLPASAVSLAALRLAGLDAGAARALGLDAAEPSVAGAPLEAVFDTPHGQRILSA